jgi:hypothetical protein
MAGSLVDREQDLYIRAALKTSAKARVCMALHFALVAAARTVAAQEQQCPRGMLPAYAHNDYFNARPLTDALELGFRGVEADVFLVHGTLRLGHERKQAELGPSFAITYLVPLRQLVARCRTLTADAKPFLLTVEIKEASRETFDTLAALLSRYPDITAKGSVAIVLVGWHPPVPELVRTGFRSAKIQFPIRTDASAVRPDTDVVGLVSLDYGATMGRWWRTPAGRRKWLAAIREQKRLAPLVPIRVHDLPPDERLYRQLLDAGVDLIGTKELRRTFGILVYDLHSKW